MKIKEGKETCKCIGHYACVHARTHVHGDCLNNEVISCFITINIMQLYILDTHWSSATPHLVPSQFWILGLGLSQVPCLGLSQYRARWISNALIDQNFVFHPIEQRTRLRRTLFMALNSINSTKRHVGSYLKEVFGHI